MAVNEKHPHYHKNVAHLTNIDVYRVLERFGVTDPALQHALKKLLVAGGRGSKDVDKDIQEAIDSLQRYQEMQRENNVEGQRSMAYLVIQEDNISDMSDEDERKLFREALSNIQIPVAPKKMAAKKTTKKKVRKMPEPVKRTLARKRTAKAAARRGR